MDEPAAPPARRRSLVCPARLRRIRSPARTIVVRALQAMLVVALLLGGFRCVHHYAPSPAHARVAPATDKLAAAKVCWLEFSRAEVSGQLATEGWTRTPRWVVTTSGILVRHPKGDVLIDTGNSTHFIEEVADLGLLAHTFMMKGPGSQQRIATPPEALRAAGADPDALAWVILSHAHVDHAGGLMDLPKAPVLLPREEIDFVSLERETKGIHVVNAHARRLEGRATAIAFEAKPYQTFDESFDVFGDGAVVVVKLFGHTPGSVGTFVSLSPSKRLLHVGDTVNVTEGFERRVAKSLAMAATDHNFGRVGESVAKLAQLHEADPDLAILPAHDRLAWQRFFGGEPRCLP